MLNTILLLLQLADSLVPSEIKPGISLATVSAVLHTKDNKHVLQVQYNGEGRRISLHGLSCHLGPQLFSRGNPSDNSFPTRAESLLAASSWHVQGRNCTWSEWDAYKSPHSLSLAVCLAKIKGEARLCAKRGHKSGCCLPQPVRQEQRQGLGVEGQRGRMTQIIRPVKGLPS